MLTRIDLVFSSDMRARELFERAAAPVETPAKPDVKPSAPPVERPGTPPAPGKHPNPFRRRRHGTEPGPMPKPKACAEAMFNRDRAIEYGRAKPLEEPAVPEKKPPGKNSYSQRIRRAQSMLAGERIKHHDREIQKLRGKPSVSESKAKSIILKTR